MDCSEMTEYPNLMTFGTTHGVVGDVSTIQFQYLGQSPCSILSQSVQSTRPCSPPASARPVSNLESINALLAALA
jgi:hypothetical protein